MGDSENPEALQQQLLLLIESGQRLLNEVRVERQKEHSRRQRILDDWRSRVEQYADENDAFSAERKRFIADEGDDGAKAKQPTHRIRADNLLGPHYAKLESTSRVYADSL